MDAGHDNRTDIHHRYQGLIVDVLRRLKEILSEENRNLQKQMSNEKRKNNLWKMNGSPVTLKTMTTETSGELSTGVYFVNCLSLSLSPRPFLLATEISIIIRD